MKIQILIVVMMMTVMVQNDGVSGRKDDNLIETTCKNTPDYELCSAIIRADPSSAKAEIQDLCLIVVAAIKKKTQKIIATIDHLSKTRDKKLLPPLQQCRKYYKNAVLDANIPVAEQTVWGNPKFAETAMADTKNEADMCERQFEGVAPSPLTSQNKYIADAAAVARGAIRNLL